MATLADLFNPLGATAERKSTPQQTLSALDGQILNMRKAQDRLKQITPTPEITAAELPESTIEDVLGPMRYWHRLLDQPEESEEPAETVASAKYSRGTLDKEISELFKRNGINIRVTSGKRAAGAVGKAGNRSHHVKGNACDIVPGQGETFDSVRRKMLESPEILQFFKENGLGVLDETDPKMMAKTGATGKHFHIGPDTIAVDTWNGWVGSINKPTLTQQEWTRNIHSAFSRCLKSKFGNQYRQSDYDRIATYMTYQAALESGYGQHSKGYNYAGHKNSKGVINYNSMDEFVKAHLRTLSKWDIMDAKSLRDYVDSLYKGKYRYNAHDPAEVYYGAMKGTTARVNRYLGLSAKFGGKFTTIRQLYDESFSKHR